MKRGLVLSVLAAALLPPFYGENGSAPARRALLIANSAYQAPLQPLATHANADTMAAAMSQVGFKPLVEYDLTLAGMGTAINRFIGGIQPGDFAVVYFSGYGLQLDGANYLIPVNFDPKDDRAPGQKAMGVRYLLDQLNDRSTGTRMVILDASRRCTGFPDGLVGMDPFNKTLIAFSAAPRQTVADPPGRGANLFTRTLAKMILEPGSTPRGVLDRTQTEVNQASGGKQMPFVLSWAVDEFYFVKPPPPPKPMIVEVDPKLKPGDKRENPKDGRQLLYSWVPNGSFKMGCVQGDKECLQDESPQHDVRITKPFWMTSTEVTFLAYQKFAESTNHAPPLKSKVNENGRRTDVPVTNISWSDAKDYCTWAGGRLPTEAEWEYAARAHKENTKYPWGNKFDAKAANSYDTKRKPFYELVPVKYLGTPNDFNLYDMVGNASEWVSDFYDPAYYTAKLMVDPQGPVSGAERVVKGGNFNEAAKDLRISVRAHKNPAKADNTTGFRCVVMALAP